MTFGYARVSTGKQDLSLQLAALNAAGCDKIFKETISGAYVSTERPELSELFKQLREGDTLIVWKLDRLGRSLKDLVDTVSQLHAKGVGFKCVCDSHIDTTTSQGFLVFGIFASLAQFERELISERTRAGLMNARNNGVILGRRKKVSEKTLLNAKKAAGLYKQNLDIIHICEIMNISKTTLYNYLELCNIPLKNKPETKTLLETIQ
jgi:DNA invertase Pin-like site-specific DNA recombinase